MECDYQLIALDLATSDYDHFHTDPYNGEPLLAHPRRPVIGCWTMEDHFQFSYSLIP